MLKNAIQGQPAKNSAIIYENQKQTDNGGRGTSL